MSLLRCPSFTPARLSHAGCAGLSVSLGPKNKLRLVQLVYNHDALHQSSEIIPLRASRAFKLFDDKNHNDQRSHHS